MSEPSRSRSATRWASRVDALRRVAGATLAHAEHRLRITRFVSNRSNAVLMYHAIGDPERYGNVSVERFRRDMAYVRDRYEVVDLPEALDRPDEGPKRVAVTVDDGYRSFHSRALPVIRDLDVPVTVFVSTGFARDRSELDYRFAVSPGEATVDFNDPATYANVAAPPSGIMTGDQLRDFAEDDHVTVGNHTRTHPDLRSISDRAELREEVVGAKAELEDLLGVPVDRFCFPYGRFDDDALSVVRESHECAVTVRQGLLDRDVDRFRVPRLAAHVPETAFRWNLSDLRWALTDRSR